MNDDARFGFCPLRRPACKAPGAVVAVIIDHDDGKLARVSLLGKAGDALRDAPCLIARRDHRDDARPHARRWMTRAVVIE